MDALTPLRLRARLGGPGLRRRLAARAAGSGPDAAEAAALLGQHAGERPEGPLVWAHLPEGTEAAGPLSTLGRRLAAERRGCRMLLTAPGQASAPPPLLAAPAPAESPRPIARFLAHWRPDVALWIGRPAPPLLLDAAARAGLPLVLADAGPPARLGGRARKMQRLLLNRFELIMARDAAAGEALRRMGLPRPRIEVTGPLVALPEPPPCNEAERADFASMLRARPVWLAVHPAESELEAILAAHRAALTGAHRLLLILVAPGQKRAEALAHRLAAEGWRVAARLAEEEPEEGTEIYLAEGSAELGLWYRIAPLCFLGGTLAGTRVPDPMGPATLGSAMLAGPRGGAHAARLAALERAGALRRIPGEGTLAIAVTDLLAPDRVAELASRAWALASDGAEVEDRLAAHLLDRLRRAGA